MAGELAVLRLGQPDEEVQAVEEQPVVLRTEGGREQASLRLAEPAAVAVRVQLVEVVEGIGYAAVVVAVGLEVVDEVLAVVATVAAAVAAAVVLAASAMFVAAVAAAVVVAAEAFGEQHCLSKGELAVIIAQL